MTDNGIYCFTGTVSALCSRLYVIDDIHGPASRILLSALRRVALESGHDIISCCCPMSPSEKLEHLLVPGLELGFVTSNRWHPFPCSRYRTIHAHRFMDTEGFHQKNAHALYAVRCI